MKLDSIHMLPDQIRNMAEMKELLNAEDLELEILEKRAEKEKLELYLSTTEELLSRHEKIYGIAVHPLDSVDIRRRRLLAKHNSRGVCTPATMRESIYILTGFLGDIIEYPSKGYFTVVIFMSLDSSTASLRDLKARITEDRPAHLTFNMDAVFDAVIFINKNTLLLRSLDFHAHANNWDMNKIYLNGSRKLDGSWQLAALTSKGLYLRNFQVAAKMKNEIHNSATLISDTMWRLDGSMLLDGSRKLNAGTIKEDI